MTKPTYYSTERCLDNLSTGNPETVKNYVIYVLWECSTEFMVNNGMPTDPEVEKWIEVLESREDKNNQYIQSAIGACREYIKPTPTPMPPYSGEPTIVSVKQVKLKLKK